jgi:hypothetical protein
MPSVELQRRTANGEPSSEFVSASEPSHTPLSNVRFYQVVL